MPVYETPDNPTWIVVVAHGGFPFVPIRDGTTYPTRAEAKAVAEELGALELEQAYS